MDVSIIIVSYNSSAVLGPCLTALRKQVYSGETEVIVVDNASSDGTPDMIRDSFPWVGLIAGKENLGYSKGVNIGIRRARGRYFFILNPDTVVRPDSIQKLADFMDNTPDAGIVGPKLIFHDGNVQYSCRRFYTFRVLALRRTPLGRLFPEAKAVRDHLMLDFDHETTREVDWLLGAAMFVRREAVEQVGLMDERFFLYFEDVDWCYRMAQQGLRVYYHPDSVIVHGYARDSAQSVLNRSFVSHLVSLFRYYEKWNRVWYYIKKYREIAKLLVFVLADVLAFNAAFLSAYYLRVALDEVFTNPIFPITAYQKFVLFQNLLFVFLYLALGLYRIRRETRSIDELFDITRAIVFASILLMTSTYLGQIRTYSRMIAAFVVPFSILYDWGLRSFIRRTHRKLLALKVDMKRACVVGPGDLARDFEINLIGEDLPGLDIVGFVDTTGGGGEPATGALGSADELDDIVEKHRVQEIIILPGSVPDEKLAGFIDVGRRRVLDVTVISDRAGLLYSKATVGDLSGRPVIKYPRETRYAFDRFVKRLLDTLVGGLFVVVSAPLCVIYSLYVLSRGRKPFTYSDRLGLEGEPFALPTAGDGRSDGPSDFVNLPLFWLVFIGKMSMVGPYPPPPGEPPGLAEDTRFRFSVKPGVTGYWRVSDRREIPSDQLLAQDANYVRNWSLTQDVKLFLMSLGKLLTGRNRTLTVTEDTPKSPRERNVITDAEV